MGDRGKGRIEEPRPVARTGLSHLVATSFPDFPRQNRVFLLEKSYTVILICGVVLTVFALRSFLFLSRLAFGIASTPRPLLPLP